MRFLPVIVLPLLLGACESLNIDALAGKAYDLFTKAREGSVDGAAKALDIYCSTAGVATSTRKKVVDAINAEAEKGAITGFDCNRDGVPDFQSEFELSARAAS